MKLKLILATAILGVALAVPSASNAQPPPPTQDSVTLTEGPAFASEGSRAGDWLIIALNATSGPSGENPTGQVSLQVFFPFPGGGSGLFFAGPVTCVAVRGDTATINFEDQRTLVGTIFTAQVVDDQPDTFHAGPSFRAPTDCSPDGGFATGGPLLTGDITVVDAQPLPTSRDQCKNGAWMQFGFKNQGQCVAFVERGPGPQ